MKELLTNPFLKELNLRKKRNTIKVNTSMGKENNIIINQGTGEIVGEYTHVTTFREVDEIEFVKLFSKNIALTFDLTSAGIKAFNVLIYAVQNKALNKDLIQLDSQTREEFLELEDNKNFKLSNSSFLRGLRELVQSKIIAHYSVRGMYFINPNFVFNGDRLAFTNAIIKKHKEDNL